MTKKQTEQFGLMLKRLYEDFPQVFLPPPADVRPLKVDIKHDLEAFYVPKWEQIRFTPTEGKKALYGALGVFCRAYRYQHALLLGVERIDLDGNGAGKPTEEQAQHAEMRIGQILKRREEYKKKQKLEALEKRRNAIEQAKAVKAEQEAKQNAQEQTAKILEEAKKSGKPEAITAETLGLPKLSLKIKPKTSQKQTKQEIVAT